MRSSSTQIANQSVCVGGEYWDVWASGSNSQPASQMKPDRKGIGPCKRDSIPGDSIPTTRTGHAIRYLTSIRWRNGTALYIAILVLDIARPFEPVPLTPLPPNPTPPFVVEDQRSSRRRAGW